VLYCAGQPWLLPAGGDALELSQPLFAIAVAVHFLLGCADDVRHRPVRAVS
jgi:hypothetical protein